MCSTDYNIYYLPQIKFVQFKSIQSACFANRLIIIQFETTGSFFILWGILRPISNGGGCSMSMNGLIEPCNYVRLTIPHKA